MSREDDKYLKQSKIEAEERVLDRKDQLLQSYDSMLADGRERQHDFEQLQALFDAFVKAFPEDQKFRETAATFQQATQELESTLDNGEEKVQQYKYRLDEEKGYLRYQKRKFAEEFD